jgi:Ca2+-binding EF-hand superfamily protein
MEKLITFITKVRKIWDFALTEEEIVEAVKKAFDKYDKDNSGTLQVKDLLMEIWEVYKAKKAK